MNRQTLGAAVAIGAGLVGAVTLPSSAGTVTTTTFRLFDHPDGNINPPPYGLRYDNLFQAVGGPTGATSFSFQENGAYMRLIVTEDQMAGTTTLRLVGKVYGGKDDGATVGFGEGLYSLDFTYRVNVAASGTGWEVTGADAMNNGSLVSDGNADVAAGMTFGFSDKGDGKGKSFYFLQDEHRLSGHPQFGQGFWVGRGWHMPNDGRGSAGTQDFLFIGTLIPLPTAGFLGCAGLLGLALARRRW